MEILGLKGAAFTEDVNIFNSLSDKYGSNLEKIHLELHESESYFENCELKADQYQGTENFISYQHHQGREASIGVHVPFEHFDLAAGDYSDRQKAIDNVKDCIDLAAYALKSGANESYVVMHAFGWGIDDKEIAKNVLVESFNEIVQYAQGSGVKLRYENSWGPNIALFPQDIKDVLDHFEPEQIRFMLDLAHWKIAQNRNENNSALELSEFLKLKPDYFHLSDAKGTTAEFEGVIIDEGDIDWEQVSKEIGALDYNVVLVSEAKSQHLNNYEGLDKNVAGIVKYFDV